MSRRSWIIVGFLMMGTPLWAGTINLAWDPSATATSYTLYYGRRDGPPYETILATGPATTASVGGLTVGQRYFFAVTASNAHGESGFSNELNAEPTLPPLDDTTPPTVAMTSPAPKAIVPRKTLVIMTAEASDNVGVTHVAFSVNGRHYCTDTTVPYSCVWDVPAPPRRTYTLQAQAFDPAGNVGVSMLVTVTSSP